ncbi:MAG: PD-(D/E)XK nuclease-like domain-containing protein, partial [Candidatus Eisenbacteria bacterium]|nr:PD-(D/E)XK nuclease-like domain-containing protein [Candidatus Eisenbacteria bacterium]
MSDPIELPEPGIYPDVPDPLYRAWPAVSFSSGLWRLRQETPADAHWRITHPSPPTDAMLFGQRFHTCLLRPEIWAARYEAEIEGDGRTKEIRDARKAQASRGRSIIKARDKALIERLADTCNEVPAFRDAMERGQREVAGIAQLGGSYVKGCVDLDEGPGGWLWDTKSIRDLRLRTFSQHALDLGYHVQALLYLTIWAANGQPRRGFRFLCIKKANTVADAEDWLERPLDLCVRTKIAVRELSREAMELAATELAALLGEWKMRRETGEWPGVNPHAVCHLPT